MNDLRPTRRSQKARRGMSLVLVLAVLSISLATAYSVLQTQGVMLQLQSNGNRQASARAAAVSGLTAALRRMHLSEAWAGVGSTLTGRISGFESYAVSYTTGDALLTPGDPQYSDYPFRVTLLSTGYAQDPGRSASIATYQIRAVVRLTPKQLAPEPAGWNATLPYSVYQWKPQTDRRKSRFIVNVPVQFEGKIRIQKELELCEDYPDSDDVRRRLLSDFNLMRLAGRGDSRPFTDELHLDFSETSSSVRDLLTGELGLSITDAPSSNDADWEHPGSLSTYQIYPGGEVYEVPAINAELANVTLEADPITNPLGVFYHSGNVTIHDNVTIRGTLITDAEGDLSVDGDNVSLAAVDLPALEGTVDPVRLPVAIVRDDLRIHANARGKIAGLIAVWDKVEFRHGDQQFTLEGRILAKEFLIRTRHEWDHRDRNWWEERYEEFLLQEQEAGGEPYFPVWLERTQGLQAAPRIRIKPSSTPATYHWKNSADPIYVPHPLDEGLRWDLLEWTENP